MRFSRTINALVVIATTISTSPNAFAAQIYATNNLDQHNPGSTGSDSLIVFDSANPSAFTVIGPLGVEDVGFGGLDFDADGNLWGYASFYKSTGGAVSGLYSINTSTGAATPVGKPPRRFLDDIAFNPVDGVMYGLKTQNNSTYLWSIDLTDGALGLVGEISGLPDHHNVNGLAFDSTGGLFLLDNRNSSVYGGSNLNVSQLYQLPVDPQTGIGQLVGSQGITIDWSRDNQGYHGAVGQGVPPDYFSTVNLFATDGSSYVSGPSFGPNVGGLPPVQPGDIAILPVPEPMTLVSWLLPFLSLLQKHRRSAV